jgi:hypothetical protein
VRPQVAKMPTVGLMMVQARRKRAHLFRGL